MNCKRGDVERYSGSRWVSIGLGKDNGNTWREITLLSRDEGGQSVLLGGQQLGLGGHQCGLFGDFSTEGNISRCQLLITFKYSDLRIQLSDLPLQLSDLPFQDFFPRSHCFPICTDLPKVISPGMWNLVPQMRRECSKNNAFSRYPTSNGYQYQNRWKKWPLDDSGKGNQNAENTRFPPIMGVKDVDSFLETCRNQLRTQYSRQKLCAKQLIILLADGA